MYTIIMRFLHSPVPFPPTHLQAYTHISFMGSIDVLSIIGGISNISPPFFASPNFLLG